MRFNILVLALVVVGCTKVGEARRGYAAGTSEALAHPPKVSFSWTPAQWGGFYVQADDFGTLTTDNLRSNAVPWKLLRALPDVVPEPFLGDPKHGWHADPGKPFQRFGMVYDVPFAGPSVLPRLEHDPDLPLGYVRATVHRSLPGITLELAAANCTMCHGGRTWDAEGRPADAVWWGVPNHSLDFDGLIAAIERAFLDPRATDAALLAAIKFRFPDTSEDELTTYRRYVIPAFRKEIVDSKKRWGALHPWHFGGPGLSHGVAILHESLADDREKLTAADFPAAYVKVPNIYGVAQKRWLLIDGSYVARPEPSQDDAFLDYLTGFLPVLGAAPERAVAARPHLEKVRAFLQAAEPMPFPGPIDRLRAERGASLYRARCAVCHGDRDAEGYRYPSDRIPVDAIDTDPTRAKAIDPALAARFNASPIGAFMHAERTDAYMPPSLHGVWANAPYLHNGSVPTLWHLLTPAERPVRFWVGGHALDLEKVGIAGQLSADGTWDYPPGYAPWSEPKLYDTREPGKSNAGHDVQVAGLSDENKRDLIEYLKTL